MWSYAVSQNWTSHTNEATSSSAHCHMCDIKLYHMFSVPVVTLQQNVLVSQSLWLLQVYNQCCQSSVALLCISASCHQLVMSRHRCKFSRRAYLLQARQPGTCCQTISMTRRLAKTLLGDHWRRTLRCIRAPSALEAWCNVLCKCSTYLLTYLWFEGDDLGWSWGAPWSSRCKEFQDNCWAAVSAALKIYSQSSLSSKFVILCTASTVWRCMSIVCGLMKYIGVSTSVLTCEYVNTYMWNVTFNNKHVHMSNFYRWTTACWFSFVSRFSFSVFVCVYFLGYCAVQFIAWKDSSPKMNC